MAFDSIIGHILVGKKVQKQRENSGRMGEEANGFFRNVLPNTFELMTAPLRMSPNM